MFGRSRATSWLTFSKHGPGRILDAEDRAGMHAIISHSRHSRHDTFSGAGCSGICYLLWLKCFRAVLEP